MYLCDIIFLCFVSLCTAGHIVGMVFPGWWFVSEKIISNNTETCYYGIWETVNCIDNNCTATISDMSGKRAWLIGVAVLVSVSAVLYLLAIVVTFTFTIQAREVSLLRKLFVITMGGAGTFVILGILIFVKKKAGLTKTMALDTSHGDPGWPIILSAVSGSVAIITGIVMGIKLCTKVKDIDENYVNDPYYLKEIEKKINELKVTVGQYPKDKTVERMTKY